MLNHSYLKSLLPWIGWASLVLADEWYNITLPSNNWGKYEFVAPQFSVLFALLLWVVSLALLFKFFWKKAPAKGRPFVLLSAILLLCKPLLVVREMTNLAVHVPLLSTSFWIAHFGKIGTLGVIGLGTLGFLFLLFRKRKVEKIFLGIMLLFSPALPVAAVSFLITQSTLTKYQHPEAQNITATPATKRRVIWMIFDELDQELVFESSRLSFPNFTQFAERNFYSTQAFPPGPNTKVSLPAYIHQKLVYETKVHSAVHANLQFSDQTNTAFGDPPNIFSKSKIMGLRTALAGWFHPYCRLVGQYLDKCWWNSRVYPHHQGNFWGDFKKIGQRFTFPQRATLVHRSLYKDVRRAALSYIADPSLGMVFLHLPLPHRPCISTANAELRRFSPLGTECYFENVALADQLLGELLEELEKSGTLKDSLVIVSSDHPWRAAELVVGKKTTRIPLMLKLPGISFGKKYRKPINTVGTGELSLRYLAGDVRSYQDVERVLNQFSQVSSKPSHRL